MEKQNGTRLLEGKRGIVMGVANNRSIAWSCAQACAAQGAQLAFNFLGPAQEKRVKDLLTEMPGSLLLPCDVSRDEDIASFFAEIARQWDTVDFVIHAIAYADKEDLKGKFLNTPRANFAMALDVSAYSLVAVAREAAPLMREGGSLVAMSYYGGEKVVPHYNVMGVAKAALEMSCRYLAEDLGPQGIRVNCISAGPLRTLSSSAIPGLRVMLDATQKYAPLRRALGADEVGKAALYLVSSLSSAVTGEVHHVDLGYNILGMFVGDASPAEH